jgi:hypothetical protein
MKKTDVLLVHKQSNAGPQFAYPNALLVYAIQFPWLNLKFACIYMPLQCFIENDGCSKNDGCASNF